MNILVKDSSTSYKSYTNSRLMKLVTDKLENGPIGEIYTTFIRTTASTT